MTRNSTTLTCDFCGKDFELMPADARKKQKNKHVFCKQKCYWAYKKANKLYIG